MSSKHMGTIAMLALLAGCATVPQPLRGTYSSATPEATRGEAASNERVRWGGRIISTSPDPGRTCIEVLGRPLASNGRPLLRGDTSIGRFLACREGFYDPAVFAPEREVTVTGRVDGIETRPIGEYEYPYPRVAAEVIYLWPERERIDPRYSDPIWYPAGYWWNAWPHPRWRPLPPPRARSEDR